MDRPVTRADVAWILACLMLMLSVLAVVAWMMIRIPDQLGYPAGPAVTPATYGTPPLP